MSGVADDGAARLDQVMRKHQVGPKSAMARNPSQSSRRASREVESQADQQPGSSSPDRPQPTSDQENTAQVICVQKRLVGVTSASCCRQLSLR